MILKVILIFCTIAVLSQEEYNERQRSKRVQEFAPPSLYKIEVPEFEGGLHFSTKKKKRNPVEMDVEYDIETKTKEATITKKQGTEIPPPLSYDNTASCGKSKKLDLSESIEMGLNKLRREVEKNQKKESCEVEIM